MNCHFLVYYDVLSAPGNLALNSQLTNICRIYFVRFSKSCLATYFDRDLNWNHLSFPLLETIETCYQKGGLKEIIIKESNFLTISSCRKTINCVKCELVWLLTLERSTDYFIEFLVFLYMHILLLTKFFGHFSSFMVLCMIFHHTK